MRENPPTPYEGHEHLYPHPISQSLQMRLFKKCARKNVTRKWKERPSFFKVLVLEVALTRQLRLPPVFVNKYGSYLRGSVKLRICDKSWKVKVEEMDSHQYFTHGWNNFVKDVGLKRGEFLVFRMAAKAVFRVSVFEITGCKREFSGNQFPSCDSDYKSETKYRKYNDARDVDNRKWFRPGNDCKSESEEGNPDLCHSFTLKLYQKARLMLPKKYVIAAGLQRLQHITLEYLPGHRHQVVAITHKEQYYRSELRGGWTAFLKANLIYGKTYSLHFISSKNVMQVKEVETDSSC